MVLEFFFNNDLKNDEYVNYEKLPGFVDIILTSRLKRKSQDESLLREVNIYIYILDWEMTQEVSSLPEWMTQSINY